MELKKIFEMTKADRYTQDGRDQIAKLQETEDVRYKTGDISQKTGLQKQPDGSKVTMKHDGKKITSVEYEAPGSKDAAPKLRELTGDCKIRIRPETKDAKVYQIGEISQKTGLQKTANGWRPVKKNGAGMPLMKEEDFIGKTYKDFVTAIPRGQFMITRNQDNPDGSSENDFTDVKNGGKKITVKFDKSGKITSVKQHESPTRQYTVRSTDAAPRQLTGDTRIRVKK
jgi:hypothetical protein